MEKIIYIIGAFIGILLARLTIVCLFKLLSFVFDKYKDLLKKLPNRSSVGIG